MICLPSGMDAKILTSASDTSDTLILKLQKSVASLEGELVPHRHTAEVACCIPLVVQCIRFGSMESRIQCETFSLSSCS